MSGMHLSREFFELLKAIGESKSKQEEDRIIAREVMTLKKKMESPSAAAKKNTPQAAAAAANSLQTNKKRAKEFLVRLLYVEMLGHDGSFGYIKAVELAASSSIVHKRTGYLVCCATLSPEHEFRFMLVNQMQRDLNSSHVLEVSAALVAVTSLITSDMVPAIQAEVGKLLTHNSDTIRKKAIVSLHRFHQIAPESVPKKDLIEKLRRVLCDKDPSVMGSSLNVIESLASRDPAPFKDLVPSLVSILKQICEHRLPSDFDYHRVPAPWIQMKLVQILGILGKNDAAASSGMYEILADCMRRADVGINAGYAVVYECVRTITTIYPNSTLLDAAAEAISRFISSRSNNLKYLGVTGLAAIVESHPQYAAAHQHAVIDCLEDPDETLQRKTLDLLYRMTNPINVEFITEKLLHFLKGTETDLYLRHDLTQRICRIAERYAPNNEWYVRTITQLFEISGDMVKHQVAQNLMSLIAEGTAGEEDGGGGGEEADMLLRQNAVELYANLLHNPAGKLPRVLAETMAWVLGEYAYLSAEYTVQDILTELCNLARVSSKRQLSPTTRHFLVQAIMKLVAQAGTCPPHAAKIIDDFTKSKDPDLQQRCLEFQNLLTTAPHLLGEVLPVDASCEDVDVDQSMSFLDVFVSDAMKNGANPYRKPDDDDDDEELMRGGGLGLSESKTAFKMTPYEKPTKPAAGAFTNRTSNAPPGVTPPPGPTMDNGPVPMGGGPAVSPPPGEPTLMLRNVANVWGKSAAPAPPPAPAVPAPSVPTPSAPAPIAPAPAFAPPVAAPEPVKTAEQLQRETMAAGLFGGIVPGATPPTAPPPAPRAAPRPPKTTVAASPAPPPAPVPAPPPAPVPATVPAPAPEIDLLDLSFGDAPPPAPSADTDILMPTPVAAAPAVPEPVSEAPPPPPPPAPAPAVNLDPFAAEGLLGDVADKPLATLEQEQRFEYSGTQMTPLPFTTEDFGGKWGVCPATSPLSVTSSKVTTLAQFMDLCTRVGCHPVESIAATNEGIAAGAVAGGSILALVHGKISPQPGAVPSSKIDVTIKSTDATMGGCFAMYLQNKLR